MNEQRDRCDQVCIFHAWNVEDPRSIEHEMWFGAVAGEHARGYFVYPYSGGEFEPIIMVNDDDVYAVYDGTLKAGEKYVLDYYDTDLWRFFKKRVNAKKRYRCT